MKQGFVFEISTQNGDGFLIGKDGTLVVGVGEKAIETIVKHIGILSVFIKNKSGNLNVADLAVEDSGFAGDVDTFDPGDIFQGFGENMVGGETKGIIDIENYGV